MENTKRILVIGGGFGGLWAAVSAARKLDEAGAQAEITLINRDEYHSIRVRNYEEDLSDTLVPLREVLEPAGIKLVIGEVTGIDTAGHFVTAIVDDVEARISYDKLVLASGSHLVRPPLPGLAEYSFDVDTYAAAKRLQDHIGALAFGPRHAGRFTAIVVGAGATGVEIATELPARLRAAAMASGDAAALDEVRVMLADCSPQIADQLGGAQPVIERACGELGIELAPEVTLKSVSAHEVEFSNGTRIPASTVVWCAGMRASGLAAMVSSHLDARGRLYIDEYLRVKGVPDVYAAGDAAHMLIDGEMPSMMSCQHARPMGRFAGNNVAAELLGEALVPLSIDWYTNIIDLGPWGAVYTETWERIVRAEGEKAKMSKTVINRQRIYPPRNGNRADILAAGSLDLQRPPSLKTS